MAPVALPLADRMEQMLGERGIYDRLAGIDLQNVVPVEDFSLSSDRKQNSGAVKQKFAPFSVGFHYEMPENYAGT